MKYQFLLLIMFTLCCLFGCKEQNTVSLLKDAISEAEKGEWTQTLKLSNKAIKLDKDNRTALLLKAIAAENCGDYVTALDAAAQAVKLTPDNFVALYTLGRLYSLNNSRLSEALATLNKALSINPNDRNTLILLVNSASKLSSNNTLYYLNQLGKIDGALVDTYEYQTILGIAYVKAKSYNNARKSFVYAYRQSAKNPNAVYNIAVFLDYYVKQKSTAIKFYEIFLKQTKNIPEYNNLQTLIVKRLKQIRKNR